MKNTILAVSIIGLLQFGNDAKAQPRPQPFSIQLYESSTTYELRKAVALTDEEMRQTIQVQALRTCQNLFGNHMNTNVVQLSNGVYTRGKGSITLSIPYRCTTYVTNITQELIPAMIHHLSNDELAHLGINVLVKIGEPSLNPLIAQLFMNTDHDEDRTKENTVSALIKLGQEVTDAAEKSINPIFESLENSSYSYQVFVAEQLNQWATGSVARFIEKAREEGSLSARGFAIITRRSSNPEYVSEKTYVDALEELHASSNSMLVDLMRTMAKANVLKNEKSRVLPIILAILNDSAFSDHYIIAHAADLAGQINDSQAIGPLLSLMDYSILHIKPHNFVSIVDALLKLKVTGLERARPFIQQIANSAHFEWEIKSRAKRILELIP